VETAGGFPLSTRFSKSKRLTVHLFQDSTANIIRACHMCVSTSSRHQTNTEKVTDTTTIAVAIKDP